MTRLNTRVLGRHEGRTGKECKNPGIFELPIAHCRNVRALGRVSYIDQIENLNISTEMLLNEKLPNQV